MAQTIDSSDFAIKEQTLKGFVVTGQYKAQRIEDAVQRVRVIDAKKIAAMGAQNLRDVLLNEMNVTIAQDNVLGSSVKIQGVSGQNVKILIDGVPVIGRQDGNIDVSQLNVYNVERIEMVEGPMSVNYGTDALAGTINIITKSSIKNKLEAGLNTYTESIGKYNTNAHIGYKKGKHTFIVSGARNFFDGWDENVQNTLFDFKPKLADSNRSLLWDAKEEYNANAQYSVQTKATALRIKSDYFYDVITNRGAPNGYYGYKAFDDYYYTTRLNNAMYANGKILGNKNYSVIAAYNYYKRIKNTYEKNLTTLDKLLAAASDQDTARYSLFNSRATFGSAQPNADLQYEIGYDINIETGYGKRILGQEKQIGDYAVYASSEYKITDSLTVRAGLRYAYNTAFKSKPIPSLNVKYCFNKTLVFRASYARGFRSPNVKELYFEFKDSNHDIVGNPNLSPEESDNFNIAAHYQRSYNEIKLGIEASAFYNSISNMISLAQPDTSILRYTYVNIDKFKSTGVQLNVNTAYKNISLSVGASYIGRYNQLVDTENSITPDFKFATEWRCNATYQLPKYGLSTSLFWKYTGAVPSYGLDASSNLILTKIAAYSLADISIS
ncbi:MAG: TonB-dependent receptor, partial [Chitinophagaceae bacterium]|nr:TonB-dependent receptor [Chitinophagaceae bacterium]